LHDVSVILHIEFQAIEKIANIDVLTIIYFHITDFIPENIKNILANGEDMLISRLENSSFRTKSRESEGIRPSVIDDSGPATDCDVQTQWKVAGSVMNWPQNTNNLIAIGNHKMVKKSVMSKGIAT
jgi:hypothetical protein